MSSNRAEPDARTDTPATRHAAFLDGAFTLSGDAITFVRNGQFIDCNDAVLRMFGYSDKADFLSQNPATLSPEIQADGRASRVAADHYMARAAAEGNVLFEWLHLRKDGSTFPAEVMIILFDLDGDQALAVTVRDITQRRQAEAEIARQREALHQSEKLAALGSLLAGVAHELNNPLSVVLNHAAILQEISPDPLAAQRAKKIEDAAERCARIIKSFLAIARQRPPSRNAVLLPGVVAKALELTSYGLRASGVAVHVDFPPDLPAVWADEDQLIQVFMNLIVNAQQAMDGQAGPRILRIFGRAENGVVATVVEDSGPGVPAAIRSRVFDPFFTTKAVGAGTGIGLALCRSTVESHGGAITSADAPRGARFVVTLPAHGSPDRATEQQPGGLGRVVPGRPDILIVDDEVEVAEVLRDILLRSAGRIDLACDGQEALRLVAENEYALIISDLRMPVMDGQALHQALLSLGSPLAKRMIFISGDLLSEHAQVFLSEIDNPILEKPFTPSSVRAVISEALASSA